jgi:hypothetical protein
LNRLAIVGTHTRTRDQAPWNDPAYDIWVFNEAAQKEWCQRWDVCFQMHKPEVYRSPHNFVRSDHWEWLQQDHGDRQIYLQDWDAEIPNGYRYPLDEVRRCIPGASLEWFKSSFAYALALAYLQGYREIDIYGADMASNTEYGYQLPNFQFWIGIGMGMGIRFGILSNERFFGGSLYGFDGEIQIPRDHFAKRIGALSAEKKHAEWEAQKGKSRLDEAIRMGNCNKTGDMVADYQELVISLAQISGALEEAQRYSGRDDLIPRQEFERTSAQAQQDAEDARRDMWKASGEVQYVWNAWNQTGSLPARDQMKKFIEKQMGFAREHGYRAGRCRENMDYMLLVDDLITAAGGMRTVKALEAANG